MAPIRTLCLLLLAVALASSFEADPHMHGLVQSSMPSGSSFGVVPDSIEGMLCDKCSPVLRTRLGTETRFRLDRLPSLGYLMAARGVLLEGFTALPETTAIVIFDAANSQAFVDTYGTQQWFLPNGTYTYLANVPNSPCFLQVGNGTFADLVGQYSGLLYSSDLVISARNGQTVDPCSKQIRLRQYGGLIDLTELPNAVTMLLDERGIIYEMDATGPQDINQLLGGLYTISYVTKEYARVGTRSWASVPALPAACASPIPYAPCFFAPSGCGPVGQA